MAFRKIINSYVSRVKGESYRIDDRVPTGYLLRISIARVIMKLRGRLLFIGRAQYPFVGNNVSVGRGTKIECTGNLRFLGKGLTVEDNVGLGTDNFFGCAGGIHIGKDTIIGNFVSFHAENHIFSDLNVPIRQQGVEHKGIRVGGDCWIGAKCTILDGAIIEEGCIIAAGALVIAGTYQKNGIYGGVPAKLLKYRS